MVRSLWTAAFLISAMSVYAQDRGPGGKGPPGPGGGKHGGGKEEKSEPKEMPWAESLETGQKKADTDQKFILMYVRPAGEVREPACFTGTEALKAATNGWIFVRRDFSKEDKELKRLKVTAPGVIIGLDRYLNDFKCRGAADGGTLQAILIKLPNTVLDFRQKIAGLWAQAIKSLDAGAEEKAVKPMVEIVASGKRGYIEIVESFRRLREAGAKRLDAADDLLVRDDAAYAKELKDVTEDFKGTPVAISAEILLARLDRMSLATGAGIARLTKAAANDDDQFAPEVAAALAYKQELIEEGRGRVDTAAKLGASGEVDAAKETLRKIATEYKGTDVESAAQEALKKLG